MPPKVKITRDDIIQVAIRLVRERGVDAVNARSLASSLNCSTQPIFSNFATMEELQKAILSTAYEMYYGFLNKEAESGKYPVYKAYGMAYIRFASEEKELFKLLFMRDRSGENLSPSADFQDSEQMIMKANGVTVEQARLMHMEMWSCVHGIGVMIATSFLHLEWDIISNMLSDVYQGICKKHTEENNERN